jgi:hypothetical protein
MHCFASLLSSYVTAWKIVLQRLTIRINGWRTLQHRYSTTVILTADHQDQRLMVVTYVCMLRNFLNKWTTYRKISNSNTHTHIHSTHTYIHINKNTYRHTDHTYRSYIKIIHTYSHTYIQSYIHTVIHTYTYTHTYVHAYIHTYT